MSEQRLHVYTDGFIHFVAHDPADASALADEVVLSNSVAAWLVKPLGRRPALPVQERCAPVSIWRLCDPSAEFVTLGDGPTKTFGEWAAKNGRGLLAEVGT